MYNSNRIENIFKVRTLIVIMMCLVLNNIYAHIVFTNFVNLLENQDVYDWIAISNSPSLETGENILWNLTNAECVGEALPIKCFVSNESEKLGIKTGASNHEMAYVASLILSLCFLFVWHKKTR